MAGSRRILCTFSCVCASTAGAAAFFSVGARACGPSADMAGASTSTGGPLREVRVLLSPGVERMRLQAPGRLRVLTDNGVSLKVPPSREGVIVATGGDNVIHVGERVVAAGRLTIQPPPGTFLTVATNLGGEWSDSASYPGVLHATVNGDGLLELINAVQIEPYVAGVVAEEVWPTFRPEAFRAQAIAARTFVLYQMTRRSDSPFDVVATQGSQVYRGIREDEVGRRARQAAEDTRGLVCVWNDGTEERLFPAFYSAACGGMSQSAAIFGDRYAIAPLAGGVRCDGCRIGPPGTYRWGPVRVEMSRIASRLRGRYPAFAGVGELRDVSVIERTPQGRPVRLRLSGTDDEALEILAERFRHAVDPNLIRSTHCTIRVDGDVVEFSGGRGFGHGLGLCQWGMEAQARDGKKAAEILRYYYPGSRILRVY